MQNLVSGSKLSTPIFKFQQWFNEGKIFNEILEQSRNNILQEGSLEAKLSLVKFFLGHSMTKEALSYLEYVNSSDQSYYDDDNFKCLYVAALYFSKKI